MKNPMSVEALADWLRSKPAEERYWYSDNKGCLICQYFDYVGIAYAMVGTLTWEDENSELRSLPEHFNAVAMASPWNYGAALERALRTAL